MAITACPAPEAAYEDAAERVLARPLDSPALVRENAAFVASVGYKLLGRSDELADLVQDVLLVAVRGIGALRQPEAVRPWLATVTVRLARRRLRARRLRRWCGFDEAPEYQDVAAPGATPEDRALLARVYAILDELPVDQRVAWTLRHVQGYGLEVIAEICGCSLAAVKRRITAAHAVLESKVSEVSDA